MKIFIAGIDGYLGWTLAQYLATRGHEIAGVDNYNRRNWVKNIGGQSATPIARMTERLSSFKKRYGKNVVFTPMDLKQTDSVENFFQMYEPDVIVHFGEMPSAPWSMISTKHALYTHHNNIDSTLNILFAMRKFCPNAHLVKLGTMGEYGTPNVPIPEGYMEVRGHGRTDTLPFPKQPGSFYHATKVHDTTNIQLACRIWGLRSTDIMQGVVYGVHIPEMGNEPELMTRFDFDHCFGTAINRFCAQAIIEQPLTPYGKGTQIRSFLPLIDSMRCIELIINNPPDRGEHRVVNQFEHYYTLNDLAQKVSDAYEKKTGNKAKIRNVENPRYEKEEHFYLPERKKLVDMGYAPTADMQAEIGKVLDVLMEYHNRIEEKAHMLMPDIQWTGKRRRVTYL